MTDHTEDQHRDTQPAEGVRVLSLDECESVAGGTRRNRAEHNSGGWLYRAVQWFLDAGPSGTGPIK